MVKALEEELVGPCPRGTEIDCDREIAFPDRESSYGPWRQRGPGDEILQRDRPIKRYGIGVLYPPQTAAEVDPGEDEEPPDSSEVAEQLGEASEAPPILADAAARAIERIAERQRVAPEGEEADFDLSTANAYRPSAMALSFVCSLPPNSTLVVTFTGGRYRQKNVHIHRGASDNGAGQHDRGNAGEDRLWWLRSPVRVEAKFAGEALVEGGDRLVQPSEPRTDDNLDDLDLSVAVYARPRPNRTSLVTVSVVNRSTSAGPVDLSCIFQSRFTVRVEGTGHAALILPYEESGLRGADEEEESLALLYRAYRTFAVGHGCAADWSPGETDEAAIEVRAECLPSFEAPSITPDITDEQGNPVVVPMAPLAGLVEGEDGLDGVLEVIRLFEAWIDTQEGRVASLASRFQATATRHVTECRRVLSRMRAGLEFLGSSEPARRAFRLANHAMLLQQLRTHRREPRRTQYDGDSQRIEVIDPLDIPDWRHVTDRGSWRPFQIAFVLAAPGVDRVQRT